MKPFGNVVEEDIWIANLNVHGMELKFMYKLEKRYFNQIQKHV